MKLLIIFCISILVISGCKSDSGKIAEEKKQAALDSMKREQYIERIKEIKRKYDSFSFTFLYNENTGKGEYKVETKFDFNKLPSAHLWLRILDNGDLLFGSVYFARERLYHTRLQVKINDSTITSEEVPLYDNSNIVEGSYIETVWFTNKDNGILNRIVSSRADIKIQIRLLGGVDRDFEYALTENDINKLKDGFEFAGLIKFLKLSAREQNKMFGL